MDQTCKKYIEFPKKSKLLLSSLGQNLIHLLAHCVCQHFCTLGKRKRSHNYRFTFWGSIENRFGRFHRHVFMCPSRRFDASFPHMCLTIKINRKARWKEKNLRNLNRRKKMLIRNIGIESIHDDIEWSNILSKCTIKKEGIRIFMIQF